MVFDAKRYSESRVPWPVEDVPFTRVHTHTHTRAGTGACAHACTLAGEEEASRLWSWGSLLLLLPSRSCPFPSPLTAFRVLLLSPHGPPRAGERATG